MPWSQFKASHLIFMYESLTVDYDYANVFKAIAVEYYSPAQSHCKFHTCNSLSYFFIYN